MAEENRDLKEKNDEADVFFICTEDARQFSAADSASPSVAEFSRTLWNRRWRFEMEQWVAFGRPMAHAQGGEEMIKSANDDCRIHHLLTRDIALLCIG